jgi:beta-xylosidase
MIRDPILPGFNPDARILRVGDDYYCATGTSEWFPGVALYHSRTWRRGTRSAAPSPAGRSWTCWADTIASVQLPPRPRA